MKHYNCVNSKKFRIHSFFLPFIANNKRTIDNKGKNRYNQNTRQVGKKGTILFIKKEEL